MPGARIQPPGSLVFLPFRQLKPEVGIWMSVLRIPQGKRKLQLGLPLPCSNCSRSCSLRNGVGRGENPAEEGGCLPLPALMDGGEQEGSNWSFPPAPDDDA